MGREDHLRRLGREAPAGVGGAGLHDHRPALHGTGDVERPAHRQMRPLVVEDMELRRIEIDPGRLVAHERVVGKGIPEPRDDIEKLARPVVSLGVRHVLRETEVQRGIGVRRRHDVPAGAAAAQMVERCEAPRDVERRIEGGRRRGDETDPLGDGGERGEQREGLEGGDGVAAFQRLHRHVEHREVIGHEERVEPRRLEPLREAFQMREVEVRVRPGAGIAPAAGVDADRPHEGGEMKLAMGGHG